MSARVTGKVKWFNRVKGYGFVVLDEDGSEVFVHVSAIAGGAAPELAEEAKAKMDNPGLRVSFELADSEKGNGKRAVRVEMG